MRQICISAWSRSGAKRKVLRWEEAATTRIIEKLERIGDPRKRLHALFASVTRHHRKGSAIYVAIAAAAIEHPIAAEVLSRVTARRLEFVVDAYRMLGLSRAAASDRALLAYAAYLGLLHLERDAASAIPRGAAFERYVKHVVETLLPPKSP